MPLATTNRTRSHDRSNFQPQTGSPFLVRPPAVSVPVQGHSQVQWVHTGDAAGHGEVIGKYERKLVSAWVRAASLRESCAASSAEADYGAGPSYSHLRP